MAATTAADPGWQSLARVAAGEAEAFGEIVAAHQDRLLRLCERLLGDPEEARDAAQETFLKAFRKAADFKPQGQVYTWLYRIAVNHCFNKLRRRKLVRFLTFSSAAEFAAGGDAANAADPAANAGAFDPPDGAPDALERLAARASWRATRRAIDRLPENQRAVLVLARFEGLSYRQIAEVLEITEGAVESRLVRAMRRLGKAQDSSPSRVTPRERTAS